MADGNQFSLKNQPLLKIKEFASLLHQLRESEEFLLAELNSSGSLLFESIRMRYDDNAGPVNKLRKEIADRLAQKETITAEFIENRKREIEDEIGRSSFKSYTLFSILFPFFQHSVEIDVKAVLTQFSVEVQNRLELVSKTKVHTVDFWGPRGFGDDRAWTAIYNASHVNQQTAKQLFIEINQNGCFCGMYDRMNGVFLEETQFEIDDEFLDKIVDFFRSHTSQIIADDYELASFLQIGAKGAKFFKLSLPKNSFNREEIQACIDADCVVFRKQTPRGTHNSPEEYELFTKAKKGDLFYLYWEGTQFLLIGQFIDNDPPEEYTLLNKSGGWMARNYRIIREVQVVESYRAPKKVWTPSDSSTFARVPEEDYNQLNQIILRPYFKAELIADKVVAMPENKVGVTAQKEIKVFDDGVSPKLEVNLIAKEFANIINNLEDNKGQMLGVFGSWGRGKTFFVDCVKQEFKADHYVNITFNAWKYQETEAIWAYLYETILDTYLADGLPKESSWLKRKWTSKKRTFSLNFKRKGYTKFIRIFVSFIASIILAYFITASFKLEFAEYILSAVGIIGVIQAYVIYKKYYQGIKDVLNDYSSKVNYRSVLGLQAEIQDELIVLVKQWFKGNDHRRIVLFVDDLDRCNEDKIIHIIDALRVMLDEDLLVKKLIIIVAVDELLLERAIDLKYADFKIDKKDKNLVQEYMDKLFIAGIKFPSLNRDEQAVILENYAIRGEILEAKAPSKIEVEPQSLDITASSSSTGFIFPDPEMMRSKVIESEFFLLRSELELLQKYAHEISTNVTPRGLRIYMYRYLLSKNLASAYMANNARYQLDDSVCTILAKAIAHRSANSAFEVKGMEEMKVIESGRLKDFLPKLIEMVVPY